MLKKLLDRIVSTGGAVPPEPAATPAAALAAREIADRLIAQGNRDEDAGNLHAACESYRQAVAADSAYGKAHLNLGIGLEAAGEAEAAIRSYEAALAIDPNEPYANYNLGKLLYTRGELARAGELLARALESKPEFPQARVVLGSVFDAQGRSDAAAGELEAALRLQPLDFGTLCIYAAVLRKLDRLAEAEQALRRATAIQPDDADVNFELGTLLRVRNQPGEAEPFFRRSVQSRPEFLEAHAALSDVCKLQGNLADAAAELEAVLRLKPDWYDAMCNYGIVLADLRRHVEAEAVFRRVIAADPNHFRSYHMLARVLFSQSRLDEAADTCRLAATRFPNELGPQSGEVFMLCFSDSISDAELFERHKAVGARLERDYSERFKPFANAADPQRRLRIGYVSADLHYHPVGQFLLPVIEHRDRAACEVYCYYSGATHDAITRKLAAAADGWRDVATLSEIELADRIHGDQIDILVDLLGHSGVPQLRVFAQRPAPVQATWLGYLNTTGMTRIQYRISDAYADPPGLAERLHTETLVRLPHSQWCYRPFLTVEPAAEPPHGRNGYITFGSFNQIGKISATVCRMWAEVLRQLPDARLVIVGFEGDWAQERIRSDFAAAGIPASRVDLQHRVPLAEYYRAIDATDIALDTTPYSGGTTTCDTLWMGVPVVTLAGTRPMSRSAASLLATVGLSDWIAATADDYVRLAVEKSRRPDRLRELRRTLRPRMQASPLMDEERFTRELEAAYRRMWAAWCERRD